MFEYAVIFVLLLLIGFDLPLAEETVLLLAAYLVASGSKPIPMMVFCVVGIVLADTARYVRGRVRSAQFKGFKRGKNFISSAGFFAVFTARFFIASRVVMPFMAGAMKMNRLSFHVASVCGAFVISAVCLLGGTALYSYLAQATSYAAFLWMVLLVLLTGWLIMFAARSQVQLARDSP